MTVAYKFPNGTILREGASINEVPLRTLKAGDGFDCILEASGSSIPGILLEWNECSALVWLLTRKPRTIKLSDGREVPLQPVTGATRWSSETLVVPNGTRAEDFQQLIDSTRRTNMSEEAKAAVKKAKGKKAKAAPKPKEYKVTTYEGAAKASTDKGQELAKRDTHNGVLLAAIVKHGPVTFDQLKSHVPAKAFGSESKNVDNIYRWHVQDLIKKGFVKSTETKVEATSAEEARQEGAA